MKMCNMRLYYMYKYEKTWQNEQGITIGTIQKINNKIYIGTLTINVKKQYMRTKKHSLENIHKITYK